MVAAPTLEAHWRRLSSADDPVSGAGPHQPCPRRLHTTAVIYAHCADAHNAHTARKLLIVFGGATTIDAWRQHCAVNTSATNGGDPTWTCMDVEGALLERAVPRRGAACGDPTVADSSCYLDGLYAFDIMCAEWLPVVLTDSSGGHRRPCPRAYHAAVVHDNRLIVSGGKSAVASLAHDAPLVGSDVVLADVWQCSFALTSGCCAARGGPRSSPPQQRQVVATWSLLSGTPDEGSVATMTTMAHQSIPQCYHAASLAFVQPPLTATDTVNDYRCATSSSAMLMLCCGGHNGRAWDDRLRIFDVRAARWLPPITPTAAPATAAADSTGGTWGDAGCAHCPTIPPGFCVHQSQTVRPLLIRKLLASQRDAFADPGRGLRPTDAAMAASPSMPPRDGHSLVLFPPVCADNGLRATAGSTPASIVPWAMDGLVFGGEVALTTFNTLLSIKLRMAPPGSAGQPSCCSAVTHVGDACPALSPSPLLHRLSAQWAVASGGAEYHRRLKGSPPRLCRIVRQHHVASPDVADTAPTSSPLDPGNNKPTTASPCGELSLSTACNSAGGDNAVSTPRVVCISESPDRRATAPVGSSSCNQLDAFRTTYDGPAAPEHRSFHIAWPVGVSGLLVFGGVSRGDRVLSSIYYYDRIDNTWVEIAQVSTQHPGPRSSCSVACQPPPAGAAHDVPTERCMSCGAPYEACYVFGGETSDGRLVTDRTVWELTMHAGGCGCAGATAIRHLSAVSLPLTPPPKRRPVQRLESGCAAGVGPLSPTAPRAGNSPPWKLTMALLPLKMLLAHYVHQWMPDELARQKHRLRREGHSRKIATAAPPSF